MTGADKAAILLLYLGSDVTAKVYEHMENDEIKKISKSMANLGHVSRVTIGEVVEEFNEVISPESGIFAQGDEFVRKVLEKALGPDKAQILMDELQASSYGDLVDILSSMDPKSIANFLAQEHPQAIAVILAKLKSKQTSEIISALPIMLQS